MTRSQDEGTRVLGDRVWPRGADQGQGPARPVVQAGGPVDRPAKVVQPRPRTVRRVRRRYRKELKDAERAQALQHLRELAKSGTLTLLTATKHAEIKEAAVLADLIRG